MKENSTKADDMECRYQKAQKFMDGMFTENLVLNSTVFPIWIKGEDCFWYERKTREGREYRLVNAKNKTNHIAFDHEALAQTLAENLDRDVDFRNLPISKVEISLSPLTIVFNITGRRWQYEVQSRKLEEVTDPFGAGNHAVSPDGKYYLFPREFNLWLCDLETGEETPLTGDGEKDYAYGEAGTAWGVSTASRLQALWSPDSKKVFTFQKDTRHVNELPIIHHVPKDGNLRPKVEYAKVAFPGDNNIEELRLLVIDVETASCQEVDYRQIPVTRGGSEFFHANLGWWATDSNSVYFVDMTQDYKKVSVVQFDLHNESTKVIFSETGDTQISLMLNDDECPTCIKPLPETNELLWFSERSGWAHLYLYNLESGDVIRAVTAGEWVIRHVLHYDAIRREIFVQTAGRFPERDPYYQDLVRINIETSEIKTIASSNSEIIAITQTQHNTQFAKACGYDVASASGISPSGSFAVITQSRADQNPISLLLDRDGNEILKIETADISSLPTNWTWPEPVKLKAADGKTDIYGLLFRPSDFTADKSYPVISHVFNNPELSWVSKGAFSNGVAYGWPYFDAAALAELGFIVVQIDGRGTPCRNKEFSDHSYGCSAYASRLEDHIAGIRQLANRYPFMDMNRIGISSVAGGPGAVQGLLQHANFYKVGVGALLHDSRLIARTMWGDKYEGIQSSDTDYRYPEEIAENLQGKLLLINGMIDVTAPPAGTFRVIEALKNANKDFDMLLLPNMGHGLNSYVIRRAWDYLVKNLLNVSPPKEFKLITFFDMV